ncbi:Endopolygalacturonase 9 [Phytophthora nicotianae]|uniref:Endopolygalacturonase 9 n=1 Tax=Phytophthora nicotianae TaxID=4792 RepID=A0A0W8D9J4_PHYNI|nr:Endopolygalacturonase 9 [Phytophthora nicotianae]
MSNATYEPESAVEASQIHALKQRVRHRSIGDGKSTYFGKYVSQEGSEKLRTLKPKSKTSSKPAAKSS